MESETSKTYVFGNDGDKSGLGSGLIPGMIGGALTSGLGFGGFGDLMADVSDLIFDEAHR